MKYSSLLVLFLIFTDFAISQPPETTYPGTIIYEGYYDDRSWGPIHMPFNFDFYGHPYNHFYITSNGLIIFGSGSNDYTEDPIPSPATPNNFIAAFWDDVVITPSGKILYTTIGAAPNRKCIVQWTNMGFYSSTVLMGTFSVILYEATGEIRIQYRSIIDNTSARSHGSSASIGIEDKTGTSGVRYSYHNSDAISSEQAILFTPSASGYTMNSSATYEGIYLTKNISLPEPGIPKLVSPANNSITGTSQKFEWTGSSNASYYTLKISTNSDISASFNYNTGTNNSYDIPDLALETTYYWAVFATNSTGTTWSEIYRFTTSASPPLSAVPQTIWLDQDEERPVRLHFNGGDESTKSARITSLPSQGSLYQYNAGLRDGQITSVPATLTDKDLNLIYLADGETGNGVGNFNFIISDETGDSPEGTITVNINPPGIPNFLLAAKSGNIEIQFDKPMSDPTGKEDQFTVKVDGTEVLISSVSLKPGDPYTILVTLETPLSGDETVLISYTQGDVASESGGLLPTFIDQLVSFIIQTISFPALPQITYGDPPVNLSATASSGLPVTFTSSNTTVATFNGNILSANSTGTAEITALQPGDGTFAPARYIRILTVNKADQVISFPQPGIKTFGDPDFIPEATSSAGLPIVYSSGNPAVATISEGSIHIEGAGTAVITASQEGNNLYYPALETSITLTVIKADQTIAFGNFPPARYGDPDFIITAVTSSSLGVTFSSGNPGVAVITESTLHISGAGTTSITASQAGNQNFNPAPDVTRSLIVNKADQVISFPAIDPVVYGVADFDAGASSSSGLPVIYGSDDASVAEVTDGKIHIRSAGITNISAGQPGNNNFNPALERLTTLRVEKAVLTITAADKTKIYLSPDPLFTYNCSGFVYGEDASVIDISPVTNTDAVLESPAGDYVITVSGGADNCYDFSYENGILTIMKADQTVEFISYPEKLLVNESFEMNAAASSGLQVFFESRDLQTARVSGAILTGISRGNTEIRAYQPGNENYNEAETVVPVEVISNHENILNLFTPNNDGFNDLWEIPGIDEFGRCDVRVFNRWGKMVFSSTDYHNDWDGTSDGDILPPAAYYYIIKTETAGIITGTVNIVR